MSTTSLTQLDQFTRVCRTNSMLQRLPTYQGTLFAADIARLLLPHWQAAFPEDLRPLKAVEWVESNYRDGSGPRQANQIRCHAQEAMQAAYANYPSKAYVVAAAATAYYTAASCGGDLIACRTGIHLGINAVMTNRTGTYYRAVDALYNALQLYSPHPALLAGNVATVAKAIIKDRDFDSLPVLADALEEAGCTDPKLLHNLRSPDAKGLSHPALYPFVS